MEKEIAGKFFPVFESLCTKGREVKFTGRKMASAKKQKNKTEKNRESP